MESLAIGLDIGGSWVRVALGDEKGKILEKAVAPVNANEPTDFLKQLNYFAK